MSNELIQIINSLADRFCERRAYSCLFRFLPAYFGPNGLTDGWEICREALADTRALCRDELKPDEEEDIHQAIAIIDCMLANR